MTDFAELWRTQQNAQFPTSCLPLAIDGMKLVKLDAAAGAILTGSLRSDGIPRRLDDAKRRDLERHLVLIRRVIAEVPLEPDAQAYFQRLAELSTVVLKG